jgi:hypothetical protein
MWFFAGIARLGPVGIDLDVVTVDEVIVTVSGQADARSMRKLMETRRDRNDGGSGAYPRG